jgi:hypothetical protein
VNLSELTEEIQARLPELDLETKTASLEAALKAAVLDYSKARPQTCFDTLALVAGVAEYDKPAGFIEFRSTSYGRPGRPVAPWDRPLASRDMGLSGGYVPLGQGFIPRVPRVIQMSAKLRLEPAPDTGLIAAFGSSFPYYYSALHVIDADGSTVNPSDDDLIILRAEAELMLMIAENRADKPSFRDGYNQASNSTYGGLYAAMIKKFDDRLGLTGTRPILARN